jgi:hypothetical protein
VSLGDPFFIVGDIRLIETVSVAAATQTVTFSGLSGDSDHVYVLIYRVLANANGVLYIRPNGLQTNMEGTAVFVAASGAVSGATFSDGMRIIGLDSPNIVSGQVTFFADTGQDRTSVAIGARQETLDCRVEHQSCVWNETATAITSLDVHHSAASGINAGSVMSLYRARR